MIFENFKKLGLKDLFKFANLLMGFLSTILALSGQIAASLILIILAVIFDAADGKFARNFFKTNISNDFGKELDSLADLVSFGVAPAAAAIAISSSPLQNYFLLAAAFVYICCTASRLALFNLQKESGIYHGCPSPIAAIAIVAVIYFIPQFVAISLILLGIAMMLKIRIKKPAFKME